MTLFEETFRKPNSNIQPVPLLLKFVDQQTVTMSPIGSASGKITAIRIQDVSRDIWYSWDNGVWDNAGGGGKNAPPNQAPQITPGKNNLYIAFAVVNYGAVTGDLVLGILNPATQPYIVIKALTASGIAPQGTASIEATIDMPPNPYTIMLAVSP